MNEEDIDIELIEEPVEELVEQPDEVDSEVLERAKRFGHLSREEWEAKGNDPAKYKSPEEFDKTGKVIGEAYTNKFEALKKKVDQRDREIQALIEYQQRTAQREYEKARQDLEQRLAASKDDMDIEGVSHYTKELVRLQDTEQLTKSQQMQQAQYSAQQAFIERNQHWFNDRNPDLKNRAIEIDNELKEIFPNASYEELAKKIETRMQYEHPERVLEQSRNVRPNMNQSSVNKTAIVKGPSFKGLSQEHKDTYNVYKRINPKITEAEFMQRLKADGEI